MEENPDVSTKEKLTISKYAEIPKNFNARKSASKAKKAKVAMLKKFVTKIGNDETKKDTKSFPKNDVRKILD